MQMLIGLSAALTLFLSWGLAYNAGRDTGRREERARWGLPAGDGRTDDTKAIVSLAERARAGAVVLAPGHYVISGDMHSGEPVRFELEVQAPR